MPLQFAEFVQTKDGQNTKLFRQNKLIISFSGTFFQEKDDAGGQPLILLLL